MGYVWGLGWRVVIVFLLVLGVCFIFKLMCLGVRVFNIWNVLVIFSGL